MEHAGVARYGSIQKGTRQSALVALRSGQNEGSTAVAEGLITPDELRRITEDKEMELAREALEKRRKVNDERDHLRDAFMSQEIHPDVFERVSRVVKSAAERGEQAESPDHGFPRRRTWRRRDLPEVVTAAAVDRRPPG
jgi:hypothetical protein